MFTPCLPQTFCSECNEEEWQMRVDAANAVLNHQLTAMLYGDDELGAMTRSQFGLQVVVIGHCMVAAHVTLHLGDEPNDGLDPVAHASLLADSPAGATLRSSMGLVRRDDASITSVTDWCRDDNEFIIRRTRCPQRNPRPAPRTRTKKSRSPRRHPSSRSLD